MLMTDKNAFTKHSEKVLISEQELAQAVSQEAARISAEYEGKPLLLVSILKGAFVFLSDLSKQITIPCEVGFMAAKSYFESTQSSGKVTITLDLAQDIKDYHVIVVEDIIDTGRTLKEIVDILKSREPLSLKVVTLLDKPERRLTEFDADRSLFTIPDKFVVGYGLDYGEYYRNLPYIAEYSE